MSVQDSVAQARVALRAAAREEDLELVCIFRSACLFALVHHACLQLCSLIEKYLVVADPADLAEARSTRNTLRKGKRKVPISCTSLLAHT